MENIRCFLALPLSEEIKRNMQEMQARLAETLLPPSVKVGWVRPEGLHVTLNFFGDIDASLVHPITEATRKATTDLGRFPLEIQGLGAFPNFGRPRVLWAGMAFAPELHALHRSLGEHFQSIGLPWEDRPLKPHITLGRVRYEKGRGLVAEATNGLRPHVFGTSEAARVVLYRSYLQPGGSVYKELFSTDL